MLGGYIPPASADNAYVLLAVAVDPKATKERLDALVKASAQAEASAKLNSEAEAKARARIEEARKAQEKLAADKSLHDAKIVSDNTALDQKASALKAKESQLAKITESQEQVSKDTNEKLAAITRTKTELLSLQAKIEVERNNLNQARTEHENRVKKLQAAIY